MDEAMKRRLVGVLVIVVVVFVISLMLPHPGTVQTDENNQRVTLDLTGKAPEPLHATPTPVPPVIAAAPASNEPKPDTPPATDSSTASRPDELPVAGNNMPAESMTDDEPPPKPEKPAEAAISKPAEPPARPKSEVATAAPTSEKSAAAAKAETKPSLKLENSLKQKSVATTPPKPPEKTAPKTVARAPEAGTKSTPLIPSKAVGASGSKHWFVQVGAFSEVAKAHQVLDKLAANGLKGLISPLDSSKGTLYRARIGPFASHDQAKQAQDRAAKAGYGGSSVIED